MQHTLFIQNGHVTQGMCMACDITSDDMTLHHEKLCMGFVTRIEYGASDIMSPIILKLCRINHLDGPWWLILPAGLILQTARSHTLPHVFGCVPATGAYNHFIKNTQATILHVVKQIESKNF